MRIAITTLIIMMTLIVTAEQQQEMFTTNNNQTPTEGQIAECKSRIQQCMENCKIVYDSTSICQSFNIQQTCSCNGFSVVLNSPNATSSTTISKASGLVVTVLMFVIFNV